MNVTQTWVHNDNTHVSDWWSKLAIKYCKYAGFLQLQHEMMWVCWTKDNSCKRLFANVKFCIHSYYHILVYLGTNELHNAWILDKKRNINGQTSNHVLSCTNDQFEKKSQHFKHCLLPMLDAKSTQKSYDLENFQYGTNKMTWL